MTDTPTPGEAAALPVAWLRIDPFGNAVPASPEVDDAFPVYREARGAALPTIEAIMDLAEIMMRESWAIGTNKPEFIAARESLRAALARALPVGEERDAARMRIALNDIAARTEERQSSHQACCTLATLSPDRPAEGTKP